MNKLGETQFKAEKLMIQLANEEEFNEKANKIMKMIERLSKSIEDECNN